MCFDWETSDEESGLYTIVDTRFFHYVAHAPDHYSRGRHPISDIDSIRSTLLERLVKLEILPQGEAVA